MIKTLTTVAFLAVCGISLAVPAQAQKTDAPRLDLIAQNDRLLDVSPAGKGRIRKECGSIANAHLRASCIDSLAIDEDRRSMGLRDGLTGGGDGRMNSIDRTFQGPEQYDPRFGR